MFHKGLNKEIIVSTTTELIEKEGFPAFSMRKLVEKLNVKTASLYAHIESMDALFTEVGLSALRAQRDCLLNAVGDKHGDTAVAALAESYRLFAAEHPELYGLIMQMPSGDDTVLKDAAAMTAEPFMRVLSDYRLSETQKMHWQWVLRGLMHGFVPKEQAGYFSHYPVPSNESYQIAVRCVIDGLRKEEGEADVRREVLAVFRRPGQESRPDACRSHGHQSAYHRGLQHGRHVLYRTAQRPASGRGGNARDALLHVSGSVRAPVRTGRLQPDFPLS